MQGTKTNAGTTERYAVAARSDPGRTRSGNEDACGYDLDAGVFVLCDGMGGAVAGEVASQLTVETFLAELRAAARALSKRDRPQSDAVPREQEPEPEPEREPEGEQEREPEQEQEQVSRGAKARLTTGKLPGSGTDPLSDAEHQLHSAVLAANRRVYERGVAEPELRGMGTTLVALLMEEALGRRFAWVAHAGDSRCYRYRAGELTQLTLDHSLVEEQVRSGQLTPAEAERSPLRSVITRAVGSPHDVEPEITHGIVEPGDIYLLCSDGLTRELTDAQISSVIAGELEGQPSMERACERLVATANLHGGRDNITCMLVRVL